MSYISHCNFCGSEGNQLYGTKQAELYGGIAEEVMMCWRCEPAAKFERERIIALLESLPKVGWFESAMDVQKAIRAIKGEGK